jgi:hypothetical protein
VASLSKNDAELPKSECDAVKDEEQKVRFDNENERNA